MVFQFQYFSKNNFLGLLMIKWMVEWILQWTNKITWNPFILKYDKSWSHSSTRLLLPFSQLQCICINDYHVIITHVREGVGFIYALATNFNWRQFLSSHWQRQKILFPFFSADVVQTSGTNFVCHHFCYVKS